MPTNGTTQQVDGTTQQVDGTTQQANGTTQQANGTTQQANGTTQQANGTTQQANGTTQQANGTTQHHKKPIRPIQQYQANERMDQRLVAASMAIEAVLGSPEMLARMAAFGYDRARLLQGQALYHQAHALYQQQHAHAGQQHAAISARDAQRDQAHTFYMRHVVTARLALKGEASAPLTLDLYARRRTQAGWLVQAQLFYANLLASPLLLAKMAEYGVGQAQLEAVQAQVATVASAMVQHSQARASARESTQARDRAFKALDGWMSGFVTMVRLALTEPPALPDQLVVLAQG